MIDYGLIKAAIDTWTGTLDIPASFADGKTAMFPTCGVRVRWAVTAVATLGVDEIRTTVAGDDLIPSVGGQRTLTVSVMVESMHNFPDARCAEIIADRLRTRLRWPTILDRFAASGIAFQRCSATTSVNPNWDDRIRSVCQFDLFVGVASFETDASLDTIGSVAVESDVDNGAIVESFIIDLD